MPGRIELTAKAAGGGSAYSVHTLAAAAIIIAGLYFARDVIIPFALAVLLTFLLAPAVLRLRRWGLGRIPAVMATVVVAFAIIGILGWVVTGQLLQLANELPNYQRNISQKLKAFDTPGGGLVQRTSRMLAELDRELTQPDPTDTSDPRPLAVEVQAPRENALNTLRAVVSPLLAPLATAGIVVVLVIFMLIQREDLRDRFIGLVGTTRMNVTVQALDDAGGRISRYLLMQFLINVAYGFPVGIGLYFIGVPNAFLWGVLATALRFVPYIGPLIAMALPLLLAFAVDPGWSMLLMTGALFLVVELISNNVMEPWLYGASTGISSVAIMVAALFWTFLWGPIGLLLSTPLTVCLAVAGRYVPQLHFLSVLLGNEPALAPEVRLYQRMLAMDAEEASEVAGELLAKMPLLQVYDELIIPAVSLAESDRHQGLLDEERKQFILENSRELIEELAVIEAAKHRAPPVLPAAEDVGRSSIVCLPARDDSDEVAGLMLRELLRGRTGAAVDVFSVRTPLDRHIDEIRRRQPEVVFVSSVPPSAVRSAAYVCRRLQAALPDIPVHVGVWSKLADPDRLRARLPESLASKLFTTLGPAVEALASLDAPGAGASMMAPAVIAGEAARLDALRRTRLLDAPPDEAFDRVTQRLARIFDVPISLMSLIDETRQFWMSQCGLPDGLAAARSGERQTSICGHVVAAGETLVIEDAWHDARFAGNPFVREQNIRFYAGAPLRTSDGQSIGSLCLIDHRPRRITDRDRQLLELTADTLMSEIEARTVARECAGENAAARASEADVTRSRAVLAVLQPPARQAFDQSVLVHRTTGGAGLSSTFVVTRGRPDGTVLLAVGDAGAGSFSGPLMAVTIAATAIRLAAECATAGEFLRALNDTLQGPERALPASVTAAVFSPAGGRLEVASAGHCPPLLLRAGTARQIPIPEHPPLFSEPDVRYSSGEPLLLAPGDRVLLYTDGAVDTDRQGSGPLGVEGLAELAAARHHAQAEPFLDDLNSALTMKAAADGDGWRLLSVDYRPDDVHALAV